MPAAQRSLFEDAIDVPRWLEADRLTPYAERLRRDRDIARRTGAAGPLARVRTWWMAIAPDWHSPLGARLARLRTLITLAVAALGAFAGVAAALAGFAYDGSEPVNVVRLIALLVALQLLLLALTVLLLGARAAGFRRLQELLEAVNIGAFAMSIFRRLGHVPAELERSFDWRAPRAGRFAKWQVLYWSQTAAVAFNVAAIAAAIVLVTFTDLAFGWSTTLDVDPALVSRIVRAIAWPWHELVPTAVPGEMLIEQSQFFRLQGASTLPSGASRALTEWWPFTILAIVTYGFLPRLALLALATGRLRAATVGLLLDDPGVSALLDRMASPEIETAAAQHDEGLAPLAAVTAQGTHRPITGTAHAIVWEGSLPLDAARQYARAHLGLDLANLVEAGGGRPLSADADALEKIAAGDVQTLVVFTPAWEPPLLELLDFLGEIRRRVGREVSILVTPVPDGARSVTELERTTWTTAIGRLADPRLYVEAGAA
jgi:hypothetical protein